MVGMSEWSRRLAVATLAPLKFSRDSGHFRSALRGQAEAPDGSPRPWYTYPAVDYLASLDFTSCRVLEFGSGQSTLWWAAHAQHVLAIEHDAWWAAKVRRELGAQPNVEFEHVADLVEHSRFPLGQTFDVVIVDGGDRALCAQTALKVVTDKGLVIIDNSEGHWGPPPSYPILDALSEAGYARVDFHGHAAGVWRQQCTSLCFRDAAMLTHLPPPQRKYV